MWQGIEVWGNPNLSSTDPSQGVVHIWKHSKISNAHIAVLLGARNMDLVCDASVDTFINAGGVVDANTAIFTKNAIDIYFPKKINVDALANTINTDTFWCADYPNLPFQHLIDQHYNTNIFPTNHYPNSNNPWAAPANQGGVSHAGIIINNQKGFDIVSSDFLYKVHGISAWDSQFDVDKCTMDFVRYGIDIFQMTPSLNYIHWITNSTFNRMSGYPNFPGHGIYIYGGSNDYIANNVFDNTTSLNVDNCVMGINMYFSSNYNILDNKFYFYKTGIKAFNSQTGWIGTNNFRSCSRSIHTIWANEHLMLKCNHHYPDNVSYYQDNWLNEGFQIGILWPPIFFTLSLGDQQCSSISNPQCLAGNTFNTPFKQGIESNITYNYYYPSLASWIYRPTTTTNVNINGFPISYPGDSYVCPHPIPIPSPTVLPALSYQIPPFNKVDSMKTEIATVKSRLDSINATVDNYGNTQLLLDAISAGGSQRQLRDLLLNASPLSDTVLTVLMDEDALNPAFFLQIMIHNTPVSNNLYPQLKEYINEQLPPPFRHIIKALQGNNPFYTTPTTIKRELHYQENVSIYLVNDLVDLLMDTNNNRFNDAVALLEHDNTDFSDYILFGTYLENKDYQSAYSKLNSLSANPYYSNFISLENRLLPLLEQGLTYADMDSTNMVFVEQLAHTCPPGPGVFTAKMIWYKLTGEWIPECPVNMGNRSLSQGKLHDNNNVWNEKESGLWLGNNQPNPAKDKTIIPYGLPEDMNATLKITNIKGQVVKVIDLNPSEHKIKLNTGNWAKGVYVYTLHLDKFPLISKKMIIQK